MNDTAAAILAQLSPQGARGLKIMLGAAILGNTSNSVTLRFKGSRTLNHVEISLNGRDTYDMTLGRTSPTGSTQRCPATPTSTPRSSGPPSNRPPASPPPFPGSSPPADNPSPLKHVPDAKIMLHSVTNPLCKTLCKKRSPFDPLCKGGVGKNHSV